MHSPEHQALSPRVHGTTPEDSKIYSISLPFPYYPMSHSTDPVSSSCSTNTSCAVFSDLGYGQTTPDADDNKTSYDSFPWTSTPSSLFDSPSTLVADGSPSFPTSFDCADPAVKPKPPGLIRRISQGAQTRLRKCSSLSQTNRFRDQSAGPVILRRPSDIASLVDADSQFADLDHASEGVDEDDVSHMSSSIVSVDSNNALGIASVGDALAVSVPVAFDSGVAPTISSVLEQGTWVVKVTKKSRKYVKLRLDSDAARVCWASTKKDAKPKPKSSKQFFIDDVREIRLGAEARNSRQDIQVTSEQEECWMTVIYDASTRFNGRDIKTLHFIAPNQYILRLWIEALKTVERERIEIMSALSSIDDQSSRSMQLAWSRVVSVRDAGEQRLAFEDARDICRKLEINCGAQTVRAYFEQLDVDRRGSLDYAQYERFIGLFKVRHDILAVYDAIKPAHETKLSLHGFLDFLRLVQGVNVDEDLTYWETKFHAIVHKYNASLGSGLDSPEPAMSALAFQKFMTSNTNACMAPANLNADLNRPLNEYFVSSSHNTYLMGRQVAGVSTVEGYISALAKGCRCVEVDCWDGKDSRPVVNHGRTLSSEILFEDVIEVIHKYAFASSPYPLIISLEVHCGPEQQAIMVEIMIRVFGDALILKPLEEESEILPTPEQLRGRILIKVKSTQPFEEPLRRRSSATRRRRSQSIPFGVDVPLGSAVSPSVVSPLVATAPTSPNIPPTDVGTLRRAPSEPTSDNERTSRSVELGRKIKTSNITPGLAALGVYVRGMKYSDFSTAGANMFNHIFSLAENAYSALSKDDMKRALEAHNARFLMRVYPARMRLDSSNFNPLQSWRHGVQMAALNWQTNDVNMQVYTAMFDAGADRTGYVLKPIELRQDRNMAEQPSTGSLTREGRGITFVRFSIGVISAQRLPRPRTHDPEAGMNPYIRVEVITAEDRARGLLREEGTGVETPSREPTSVGGNLLKTRTKVVEDNGFSPRFDANLVASVETKHPELLFVRWTVWNSADGKSASPNDSMVATYTAKLSSIRPGYRHLPLFNAYGERYREAKLFVLLKKEESIPINVDDMSYLTDSAITSPRAEARNDRFWSRKMFSRTPSLRSKRTSASGDVSRASTRQSSVERLPLSVTTDSS